MAHTTKIQFRLLDFHVSNEEQVEESDSDVEESYWDDNAGEWVNPKKKERRDNKIFTIEAFGKDERGDTYSTDY